jgi:hypothetical protein
MIQYYISKLDMILKGLLRDKELSRQDYAPKWHCAENYKNSDDIDILGSLLKQTPENLKQTIDLLYAQIEERNKLKHKTLSELENQITSPPSLRTAQGKYITSPHRSLTRRTDIWYLFHTREVVMPTRESFRILKAQKIDTDEYVNNSKIKIRKKATERETTRSGEEIARNQRWVVINTINGYDDYTHVIKVCMGLHTNYYLAMLVGRDDATAR